MTATLSRGLWALGTGKKQHLFAAMLFLARAQKPSAQRPSATADPPLPPSPRFLRRDGQRLLYLPRA